MKQFILFPFCNDILLKNIKKNVIETVAQNIDKKLYKNSRTNEFQVLCQSKYMYYYMI